LSNMFLAAVNMFRVHFWVFRPLIDGAFIQTWALCPPSTNQLSTPEESGVELGGPSFQQFSKEGQMPGAFDVDGKELSMVEGCKTRRFCYSIPLPYRRFRKSRRGVSVVIATLVLSSTLLVIVLSTSNYANQLLKGEVENAEFNQGKDVLSSLDKMIERVTSATGSSGYIRSGFLTTYPLFEASGTTLKIIAGETLLGEFNTIVVKIRGGRDVSGAFRSISGYPTPLVCNISAPMGWLFTNRTDAEEVVLDYSRARCVYKGLAQLWNGAEYEPFNVLEVTVVSLSSGSIAFKDTGAFVVQNKAWEPPQQLLFPKGDVQIRAEFGDSNKVVNLSDPSLGGASAPSHQTLLNFFVINVELSVVQG